METQLWLLVCFVVPYKCNTVALTVTQTRIQHVTLNVSVINITLCSRVSCAASLFNTPVHRVYF